MNNIRVMLIDDEQNVLSALLRMLRRHPVGPGSEPCVVEAHNSPVQALEAAKERTFDVFVCDFRMPEMDGIELLRQLRTLQPQSGRILLSGSRDFGTVVEAVNVAQVGRIVLKPWEDAELIGAIQEAAETRRLRIENAELANQVRVQQGRLSKQEAELLRLENQWPGITQVEWDVDGSVRISDTNVVPTHWGL